MIEERFETIYILVIIGLSLIFTGLILKFIEAQKKAYCDNLELIEKRESKICNGKDKIKIDIEVKGGIK